MSIPTPILSEFYSDTEDFHITEFTTGGSIEVGYRTDSKLVRHLSADQFNFETAVDNNIRESYQSVTAYEEPNDQSYSAKKPQKSAYIVQLTTTDTIPSKSVWGEMQSAIEVISNIFEEFNTSVAYTIRSRLDTVLIVSTPFEVDQPQLRDNLYGSFESYLNPFESGLLAQQSDYELQIGETEFNRVNRRTVIPTLYTTILDNTISKLESIKSLSRTDREDEFANYTGIGPAKASKLADLVETYPENPFDSNTNNTLTKFATAYANEYIKSNWPVSSDSISVTPLSPFTLVPIKETISDDGISVTYYPETTEVPYWDGELENETVLSHFQETVDLDTSNDTPAYIQYLSQL